MVYVENLLSILKKKKINFFSGVPDSVLKNLSLKIDKLDYKRHKIAVNEGSAVAMGIGHYLATGNLPCIYLQNSGLGNAINPLVSIAHHKVYSIPLILLIGWRGSPALKDEPQHMVKGKITRDILNLLNIKYCIIRNHKDLKKFETLIKFAKSKKRIIAGLFENKVLLAKERKKIKNTKNEKSVDRSKFIIQLLKSIKKSSKIISTTGHTSRELMKIRNDLNLRNGKDFYMVGGMGHSLSVAVGMKLHSNKQIICLDGDGSLLMHLGSMFSAGVDKKLITKHILLNNNSHESVGGQLTGAQKINFKNLSKSLGYSAYYKIAKEQEIKTNLKKFLNNRYSSFLEVFVKKNLKIKLPRPKNLFKHKKEFIS
jgi:phosphonopyruvate decarboxylase